MIAWEESPRQFKMSKQLDEGKFGEDLARKFLNDPIIKVNHGISHYDDVTQDKSYQDKDTDFIVWKKNGKTFGLEAKVDSHNTGNFYLETSVDYFSMVPDALNEQRVARRYRDGIDPLWHTPGWVYRSGADQILYYFRTTQLLYIFSRVDVYGAFVEFSRAQANARHLKIKEGQSYRIEDPRYAEHVKYLWLTADDNSDVKVYDQKRLVEYADYKPGMLYVSVYEVFPAGEGH